MVQFSPFHKFMPVSMWCLTPDTHWGPPLEGDILHVNSSQASSPSLTTEESDEQSELLFRLAFRYASPDEMVKRGVSAHLVAHREGRGRKRGWRRERQGKA